jgi:CHAT domain
MTVIELAIVPGQAAGAYRVDVVRSPAGEASEVVALDVEELLSRREQLEQAVLASAVASRAILPQNERPLREIGQELFSALLGSGDVAGRYRASAALATEREEGLRVVLRVDTAALAGLPWEAMYDAVAGGYVCRRDQLVRHVPVAAVVPPLTVAPPLRILAIISSPRGLPRLDVEKEQEQLTRALARLRTQGLIEIRWADEATWAALQDWLLGGQWHVVHFIGHGDFDIRQDEGVLALTGEDGRADLVEADRLVDLLHEARPMPRLVVLNSCSGATAGANDLFASTAAALVRGGVSAVAAMQYSISDHAAVAFARGFYTAIAHGRGVDEATSSGRVAILGTGSRTLEWVTPVMYLRGRDSRLFVLHSPSPTETGSDDNPALAAGRGQAPTSPPDGAHADGWGWESYAAELNIPPERIKVGQRLVADITAAVAKRGLPWRVVMRKGYVAIQRPGGYNVMVVDLWWNKAPRLAGKVPAEPASLGLASPFPHLPEVWIPAEREWGWTVPSEAAMPDVAMLIDLIQPLQPTQGPMNIPVGRTIAVGAIRPVGGTVSATVSPGEVLEAAIQRLEASGASRHIREAADGLRAMGYELRLAQTTIPGKRPENYLRIMDPTYSAHGIGYLTPTLFAYSRASDRDRLAALPGAILTGSSINFSHVESVQTGLAAARLLKPELRWNSDDLSPASGHITAVGQGPSETIWNEQRFLDAARACRPEQEVSLMQQLIAHVHALNGTLSWGKHATPGVSGRYSVLGTSTPVWIMRIVNGPRASSVRFELTAKWIAPRLSAGEGGFERLETAAHVLRKIPNTAGKIDIKKAKMRDWRTDFIIAFSDIAEGSGHMRQVIEAIDAIVDRVPRRG